MSDTKVCPNCHKEINEDDKFCPHCGSNLSGTHVGVHQLQPNMILNGKYRIESVIGEGNFGITYLAEDTTLQMKVAVKEFYPKGYVSRESMSSQHITIYEGNKSDYIYKWRNAFINEARNLAKLSGLSGIVEVRDYFDQNSTAYIVMEFLDGDDLNTFIEKNGYTKPDDAQRGLGKRITVDTVKQIMEPVILALEKVHEQGMVHRDISPDNMKFNSSGSLKLFDFGAAREADLAGTSEKTVMLKIGYAPEEQYRKMGKQGSWTDVYALCATMYKCITGVIPIEASERTYQDTLKKPSELGIEINPYDESALMMGLAVYADKRLANMSALHKALYRGNIPDSPRVKAEMPGDKEQKKSKGGLKPIIAIIAALIAVLALASAAIFVLPDKLSDFSIGGSASVANEDESYEPDLDPVEPTSEIEEDKLLAELQEMLDEQEYEELIEEILDLDEDDLTDEQFEATEEMLKASIEGHLNLCFDNVNSLIQNRDYDAAFKALEDELSYREELEADKKAAKYIDNQVITDKQTDTLQGYSNYVIATAEDYANSADEDGVNRILSDADNYLSGDIYEQEKVKIYSTLVIMTISKMSSDGKSAEDILSYIENNRSKTQNNCWVLEFWDHFYSENCTLRGVSPRWAGSIDHVSNSGYILDYSDVNELSAGDIRNLSAYEMRIAIYEIYARHGRIFADPSVNQYFEQYSWYKPTYSVDKFDESLLSDIERKNVEIILDYEEVMGYRDSR